jgi:transposase
LPRQKDERNALAVGVGQDGFDLLDAIYVPTAPIELRWLKAVETLRQVWLQQYYAPTPEIQLIDLSENKQHRISQWIEVG